MTTPDCVIIVVDFAYVEGGASRAALASALALQSAGIRVDVFAGAGPAADGWEATNPTICDLDPITGNSSTDPRPAVRNIWNRQASDAMDRFLADRDPKSTIVHLHTWTKVLSSSVVDAAAKRGFPVITTAHEYFLACPTGSFFHHPDGEICNRRPLSSSCLTTQCDSRGPLVKGFRLVRFATQKRVARMPATLSGVVFVSERLGNRLTIADPGLALLPTTVIASPGPPPLPAAEPQIHDRPAFIAVGRVDPEKGMDIFAEAASMLDQPASFSIVGAGSDSRKISSTHPQVNLLGWLNTSETEDQIAASSCLVMPSRWDEPYGLVVDEAARLGVPSIAPAGSDAARRIVAGNFGGTFAPGDPHDLARTMARLGRPRFQAEMSGNARDWYDENWQSPAEFARQTLGFYAEAVLNH